MDDNDRPCWKNVISLKMKNKEILIMKMRDQNLPENCMKCCGCDKLWEMKNNRNYNEIEKALVSRPEWCILNNNHETKHDNE